MNQRIGMMGAGSRLTIAPLLALASLGLGAGAMARPERRLVDSLDGGSPPHPEISASEVDIIYRARLKRIRKANRGPGFSKGVL